MSSGVVLSRPKRRAVTDASRTAWLKQEDSEDERAAKRPKVAPKPMSAVIVDVVDAEPEAELGDLTMLSLFGNHAALEVRPPIKQNKPNGPGKNTERPFRCAGGAGCGKPAGECQSGYTAQSGLVKHQQPVTDVPKKNAAGRYPCKEAGCQNKSYSTVDLWRNHTRTHLYGDWRCEEDGCGKSFADPKNFEEHKLWHALGGFKCKEEGCGKSFSRSENLEEHKLWHALGGFKCEEEGCGKSFSGPWYLEEHHAGHRGEFACDNCTHPNFMSKFGYNQHVQFCGEATSGHSCEWPDCLVTFLNSRVKNPTLDGKRLCGLHSRQQYRDADEDWPGLPSAYYCTECTAAGMPPTLASFYGAPDAEGNSLPNQLCAPCAVKAGTKSSWASGASHECDDVVHVVEALLQQQEGRQTWVLAEHVHFQVGQDPVGRELRPFRDRPLIGVDAVFRDSADGGKIVALHQHQGNRYHGHPPHHPEHKTFVCGHTFGPVAYNRTMERNAEYRCKPLHDRATAISDDIVVIETWGHHYAEYKRALKTDPAAQLEYIVYARRPGELDDVRAEMQVDASGAPTTDSSGCGHTTRAERELIGLPPGCVLCRETRLAQRAAAASTATSAATSTSTATSSTATAP